MGEIKNELDMALRHRYIELSDGRLEELCDLTHSIFNKMYVKKLTHKEAEAVISILGYILEKIPIGIIRSKNQSNKKERLLEQPF